MTIAARRVLIVDDEVDVTTSIRHGLEHRGFAVTVFNDPVDALSHFQSGCYDVVVIDVRMPRMTGFDLYRRLKQIEPDSKICFFTAYEIYESEVDQMFPGLKPAAVLHKPIGLNELARRLNEIISSANASKKQDPARRSDPPRRIGPDIPTSKKQDRRIRDGAESSDGIQACDVK